MKQKEKQEQEQKQKQNAKQLTQGSRRRAKSNFLITFNLPTRDPNRPTDPGAGLSPCGAQPARERPRPLVAGRPSADLRPLSGAAQPPSVGPNFSPPAPSLQIHEATQITNRRTSHERR